MPAWLIWLLPVPGAGLAAVAWTAWVSRTRRPVEAVDSVQAYEKFRQAMRATVPEPRSEAPGQQRADARPYRGHPRAVGLDGGKYPGERAQARPSLDLDQEVGAAHDQQTVHFRPLPRWIAAGWGRQCGRARRRGRPPRRGRAATGMHR